MRHSLLILSFWALGIWHVQAQKVYFHNILDGVMCQDLNTNVIDTIYMLPFNLVDDIVIDAKGEFYTLYASGFKLLTTPINDLLYLSPTPNPFWYGMAIDKEQTVWGLGFTLFSYHIPSGTINDYGYLPDSMRCRQGMYLFQDTLYFNNYYRENEILKITSLTPLEYAHAGFLSDSVGLAGFTMYQYPCGDVQYIAVGNDKVFYNYNPRTFQLDSIAPRLMLTWGITMEEEWRLGGYNLRINLDRDASSGMPATHWQATAACGEDRLYIGDEDICMYSDSPIDSIAVWLEQAPDGLQDRLFAAGLVPGIGVQGQGTQRLTLYPLSGQPDFSAWSNALGQIFWQTSATVPNPGTRIVHVLGYAERTCPDTAIAYLHLSGDRNIAGRDTAVMLCPADQIYDLDAWLSAEAQAGGRWYPDTEWGGSAYHPLLDGPGQWHYIVDASTDCPADTATLVIDLWPTPTLDLGPDRLLCEGGILTLSGGGGFTSYRWNGVPGDSSILVSQPGTYILEVIDANGCVGRDSLSVTLVPAGDTLWTYAEVCQGETWTWQGQVYAMTGVYTYTLPGAGGCDSILALDLRVLPHPIPSISGDTVLCPGSSGILGVGVYDKVVWNTGAGTSQITINSPGSYAVTVTASEGCTAMAEVEVVSAEAIVAQWQGTGPSCHGRSDGTIFLSALSGGYGPLRLEQDGTLLTPGYAQGDLGPGIYTFTIVDEAGCQSSAIIELVEPAELWLDAGGDLTLSEGATVQQPLQTNAQPPWSLSWTPMEGLVLQIGPVLAVSPPSSVTYTLTLTDAQGCTAQTTLEVLVTYQLNLYVPGAFSPNADGINDLWMPVPAAGKGYDILSLHIYDRWGNLLHEASGPAGAVGWDGHSRGKPLDAGVYVYDLLVRLPDGVAQRLSGELHLLR